MIVGLIDPDGTGGFPGILQQNTAFITGAGGYRLFVN